MPTAEALEVIAGLLEWVTAPSRRELRFDPRCAEWEVELIRHERTRVAEELKIQLGLGAGDINEIERVLLNVSQYTPNPSGFFYWFDALSPDRKVVAFELLKFDIVLRFRAEQGKGEHFRFDIAARFLSELLGRVVLDTKGP